MLAITEAVSVRVSGRVAVAVTLGGAHPVDARVSEQMRQPRRCVAPPREEEQESTADVDVRRCGRPGRYQDGGVHHVRHLHPRPRGRTVIGQFGNCRMSSARMSSAQLAGRTTFHRAMLNAMTKGDDLPVLSSVANLGSFEGTSRLEHNTPPR